MRATLRLLGQMAMTVFLATCLSISLAFAVICFLAPAESAKDLMQQRGLALASLVCGVGGALFLILMIWTDAEWPAWLRNLPNWPARFAAWYLKRRGWVAFYLPHESGQRRCPSGDGPMACWIALYEQEEGRAAKRDKPMIPMTMLAKQYRFGRFDEAGWCQTSSLEERAAACRTRGDEAGAQHYEAAAKVTPFTTAAPVSQAPSADDYLTQKRATVPESQRVIE